MSVNINGFGGGVLGKANATAATVYYAVIPGRAKSYARITDFQYTCGNTANDFTFMRPIGRANVSVAYAANTGASLTLDADPSPSGNTIAAGDQCVIQAADGTYPRAQVNTAGWNGTTKVVTFTANVTPAVSIGAKVFMFGISSDTDPVTGLAFPVYTPAVNTTGTNVAFGGVGFVGAAPGDPLMIYNPNATAATNLNYTTYAYTVE